MPFETQKNSDHLMNWTQINLIIKMIRTCNMPDVEKVAFERE